MLIIFSAERASCLIGSIDIACPGRESLINYTSNMSALQDQSMLLLYRLIDNTIIRSDKSL